MKRAAMTAASIAMAAGATVATTAPAHAEPDIGPIAGDSLVNVQIGNVLNNVSVTVPVQVAANVCDVNVAILTETLEDEPMTCDAGNTQWTVTQQQD